MNDGALRAVKKLYIRLCAARDTSRLAENPNMTIAVIELRSFYETSNNN
jgi:hypothetical protein